MHRRRSSGLLVVSLLMLLAATERTLPYYMTADLSPEWVTADKVSHTIADFRFTNQNGSAFGSKELAGKIYVADFFFTSCPGICATLTRNLKRVQDAFPKNERVNLVSFSVMPKTDTVEALQKYAKKFEVDNSQWHLLTGDKQRIYELARSSFFADSGSKYGRTEDDFLHSELFVLVDGAGHIRGVYSGRRVMDVQNLIDDIQLLLAHRSS